MEKDSDKVVEIIRQFVAQHSGMPEADLPEYSDDRDLFESGDLDSFGFVELLSVLGDQCGRDLDLSDTDPAELSVVGSLKRYFCDEAE